MADLNSAISHPMDLTDYKSMSSVKVSRVSIQPETGTNLTVTGGNTQLVTFSIPQKANTFNNGNNNYLSFNYTIIGTTVGPSGEISISNGSGASFIKTLQSSIGSTPVDNINNYNVIGCVNDDFQSTSSSKSLCTILEDKDKTAIKKGKSRAIVNTTSNGFSEKRKISIPLVSHLLGTLQDKYLPVGQDNGVKLELTFEDPNVVFKTATAGTSGYRLENITLHLEYLTTDSATYNALQSERDGVFKMSGTGITCHSVVLPSDSATATIMAPARNASMRNYLTTFRSSASSIGRSSNSTGARTRDNIRNWQYRYGGVSYPQVPVIADGFTSSETFCEVQKCMHALHNTISDVVFNLLQLLLFATPLLSTTKLL